MFGILALRVLLESEVADVPSVHDVLLLEGRCVFELSRNANDGTQSTRGARQPAPVQPAQEPVDRVEKEGPVARGRPPKPKKCSATASVLARRSETKKTKVKALIEARDRSIFLTTPKAKRRRVPLFHKLTTAGGYRLAARRAASQVSAGAVLLNLDVQKSRQAVSLWERRLTSALTVLHHQWYERQHEWIRFCHDQISMSDRADKCYSWAVTRVRADATNCPSAQTFKAHVVEISTRFTHIPDELVLECFGGEHEELPALPDENDLTRCCYADLEQVPEKMGGEEARNMIRYQMLNCGSRFWNEGRSLVMNPDATQFHLEVYFFGTDQGPDQKKAHELINAEIANHPYTLGFRNWCFQHVEHLICARHLLVAERFACKDFFSSCAKVVNVWRMGTNAKKLMAKYLTFVHQRVARRISAKLPQRPLRRRWGLCIHANKI